MKKTLLFCSLISAMSLASCEKDDDVKAAMVRYEVNEAESQIQWRGYMPGGNNHGTFSLGKDAIITEDGKVTGGSFSIPVSSVNVLNLTGDLKEQLEHHLLSGDFFDVLVHPEVKFEIEEVAPYSGGGGDGVVAGANYTVTGELTMLGTTREISFPARIDVDNSKLDAEALIAINRLDWGMEYASDPDGAQYILPGVDLHLILSGSKK